MTDAMGRFLICGADKRAASGLLLIVSKDGFDDAAIPAGLAPVTAYEIELKRR